MLKIKIIFTLFLFAFLIYIRNIYEIQQNSSKFSKNDQNFTAAIKLLNRVKRAKKFGGVMNPEFMKPETKMEYFKVKHTVNSEYKFDPENLKSDMLSNIKDINLLLPYDNILPRNTNDKKTIDKILSSYAVLQNDYDKTKNEKINSNMRSFINRKGETQTYAISNEKYKIVRNELTKLADGSVNIQSQEYESYLLFTVEEGKLIHHEDIEKFNTKYFNPTAKENNPDLQTIPDDKSKSKKIGSLVTSTISSNEVRLADIEIEGLKINYPNKRVMDPGDVSVSCTTSGRKKRRAINNCKIFNDIPDINNDKKIKLILDSEGKINSKKFISKYTKETDANKMALAQMVENNLNEISENAESVKKVQQIIEYEKMKKHRAKIEYSADSTNTGNFFGPDSKTGIYSHEELLKKTKLSSTKTAFRLYGKGFKLTQKVTGTLGKFFLAKGIVSGIQNGDKTSLAIMGSRIGGDLILNNVKNIQKFTGTGVDKIVNVFVNKFGKDVAQKIGKKLAINSITKFASKGMKYLGKAAGPIGFAIDVGFSAWSLSSAVQRYNNPNATKFQQNDALADIVQNTIDIAITTAVFAASIAFPPLAPLFAVIGFFANLFVSAAVMLYKAINHVNELNSKISLLESEKATERARYLIGQDVTKYLKDLILVKNANNMAVKGTTEFLKDNPDYLGRIFPSRTFNSVQDCKQYRTHCKVKIFVCLEWENKYLFGTCSNDGETREVTVNSGYDYYECECGSVVRPGNPHINSKVDLRQKYDLY